MQKQIASVPNRAVCQALVLEMLRPGRDVLLWPDAGQLLGPVALDSREHQELEDVALVIWTKKLNAIVSPFGARSTIRKAAFGLNRRDGKVDGKKP
jgi:hypothetical protein